MLVKYFLQFIYVESGPYLDNPMFIFSYELDEICSMKIHLAQSMKVICQSDRNQCWIANVKIFCVSRKWSGLILATGEPFRKSLLCDFRKQFGRVNAPLWTLWQTSCILNRTRSIKSWFAMTLAGFGIFVSPTLSFLKAWYAFRCRCYKEAAIAHHLLKHSSEEKYCCISLAKLKFQEPLTSWVMSFTDGLFCVVGAKHYWGCIVHFGGMLVSKGRHPQKKEFV